MSIDDLFEKTIEARNVEEAVELAEQFKREGRYDCFRGQSDSNWLVRSSYERLERGNRKDALRRIAKFESWMVQSSEIIPYVKDGDQILAIAQHYGLSTPLIDFTSEPRIAGFFATHQRGDAVRGSIFMINSSDFVTLMDMAKVGGDVLARFLRVDVEHLWRLQAQSGFFLESKWPLKFLYPPDRIDFPHIEGEKIMDENLIYPDEPSHLERCLNDYFLKERTEQNFADILYRDGKPIVHMVHMNFDKSEEEAKSSYLNQWPANPDWQVVPNERWLDRLDSRKSIAPVISLEELREISLVEKVRTRRDKPRLFTVDTSSTVTAGLQCALDKAWEGMRVHPYTDHQLAAAQVQTVRIAGAIGKVNSIIWNKITAAMAAIYDDAFEIEMATAHGVSTRALISASALAAALVPQVLEQSGFHENPNRIDVLEGILLDRFATPRRIFDSSRLIDLFASQIIPWQVAYQRPYIVYSPYHITTLGLA